MTIQEFNTKFPVAELAREERGVIDSATQWIEQYSELAVVDGLKNIHPFNLMYGQIRLDWCDVPKDEVEEFDDWGNVASVGIGTTNVGGVQVYFIHHFTLPNTDTFRLFADNPEVLAQMGYDVQVIKAGVVIPREHYAKPSAVASSIAEQTQPATPPDKQRFLVPANHAPNQGDMREIDGVLWACTGTGKSWRMDDNSHGDSSLEGEWVCYAYYVPATAEQVRAYGEAVLLKHAERTRKEILKSLANAVKLNGQKTDGVQGCEVLDTRPYYAGAGHGVGDVWYLDGDTACLAHYTGSDVNEWAWQYYTTTDPSIVATLKQLADKE